MTKSEGEKLVDDFVLFGTSASIDGKHVELQPFPLDPVSLILTGMFASMAETRHQVKAAFGGAPIKRRPGRPRTITDMRSYKEGARPYDMLTFNVIWWPVVVMFCVIFWVSLPERYRK